MQEHLKTREGEKEFVNTVYSKPQLFKLLMKKIKIKTSPKLMMVKQKL